MSMELLNLEYAFNHIQAFLDIGALICVSNFAYCGICPLYDFCKGKFNTEFYPRAKNISYENANLNLFVFEGGKKFAIQKSQDKLYKGMCNFPFFRERGRDICKDLWFVGGFLDHYRRVD